MHYHVSLASALRSLALALDPYRLGECWPDPIAWDGRPLDEQARDMLSLARECPEARAELESVRAELRAFLGEGGAS